MLRQGAQFVLKGHEIKVFMKLDVNTDIENGEFTDSEDS